MIQHDLFQGYVNAAKGPTGFLLDGRGDGAHVDGAVPDATGGRGEGKCTFFTFFSVNFPHSL